MACNVCGDKIGVCENGDCLLELEGDFYCFEEVHFCSHSCWERWLIDEEKGKIEEAVDDEE